MKLKNYPLYINNTAITMDPKSWSESSEVVENANTTEAGVDVVDVKRTNKLSITASYNVSSAWLSTFEAWNRLTTPLSVRIFDAVARDYVTHLMRMRNFSYNYVENSSNTSGTVGLWELSFSLMEF